MTDLGLELWTAFLAAVAAVAGIVVAISQLTSASRLRRRATFWGEQSKAADSVYDRSVAQSLHREASARIIALQAYPGKTMLFPTFLILTAVFGSASLGYTAGTLVPGGLTFQSIQEAGLDPILSVVHIPFLAMGVFGVAGAITLRRMLVLRFLEEEDLVPEHSKGLIGNGSWVNVEVKGKDLLGLAAFSLGVCLLLAVFGFTAGAPKGDLSSLPTGWIFTGILIGSPLTFIGLGSVGRIFTQESIEWRHPRKPKPHIHRLR